MTHYELLKVKPSAKVAEIRRAYRKAALRLHPDRNPEDKDADRKFKEISAAYTVLSDSTKRREYDLKIQPPRVSAGPRPGSQVPFFRRGPVPLQRGARHTEHIFRPTGMGGEPTVVNGVKMPGFRTFRVQPMRPESNTTPAPTFGDPNDSH